MRVISKKKDYFDTAGYIDPTVIFLREQHEVTVNIEKPYNYGGSGVGLLGFCGKFYPYVHVKVDSHTDPKTLKFIEEQHYYYYSFEEYQNSPFWKSERDYRYWKSNKVEAYTNYFQHWKDSDDLFIQVDAPYFKVKNFNSWRGGVSDGVIITNPTLNLMQFGKVMDAPTAFQTIQFYLTNQLVKTKDPDEVEDKYRIAQHGFDSTSFRNPYRVSQLTKKKK